MSRPFKIGLDYFPVDTQLDTKLKLIRAKFGLEGIGFIDTLWRTVYAEGYYMTLDPDERLLMCAEMGITETHFLEMLDFCLSKNLFNKAIYNEHNVLTSHGIQQRYFHTTTRRKITDNLKHIIADNNPNSVGINPPNSEHLVHKEKKRKEKNSREKNSKETGNSIPPSLFSLEGFQVAWEEWLTYRKERRLTLTSLTLKKQLDFLNKQQHPIAIIQQSIQNGWQGLFEEKQNAPTNTGTNRKQSDQIARATFEHGEADVQRFRDLKETLDERDRERQKREGR